MMTDEMWAAGRILDFAMLMRSGRKIKLDAEEGKRFERDALTVLAAVQRSPTTEHLVASDGGMIRPDLP